MQSTKPKMHHRPTTREPKRPPKSLQRGSNLVFYRAFATRAGAPLGPPKGAPSCPLGVPKPPQDGTRPPKGPPMTPEGPPDPQSDRYLRGFLPNGLPKLPNHGFDIQGSTQNAKRMRGPKRRKKNTARHAASEPEPPQEPPRGPKHRILRQISLAPGGNRMGPNGHPGGPEWPPKRSRTAPNSSEAKFERPDKK